MKILYFTIRNYIEKRTKNGLLLVLISSLSASLLYSLIPYLLNLSINFINAKNSEMVVVIIFMILCYVLGDLLRSINSSYCQILTVRISNEITSNFMKKISFFPVNEIKEKGSAHILQTLNTGKTNLTNILNQVTITSLPTVIQIIISLSVLASLKIYFVTISISIYLFLYLLYSTPIIKKLSKIYLGSILLNIEISKKSNSIISNIETIKIFNSSIIALKILSKNQRKLLNKWMEFFKVDTRMNLFRACIFLIMMSYVLLSSSYRIRQGTLSIGEFVMINTYLLQIINPFESFVRTLGQITESVKGLTPFGELILSGNDEISNKKKEKEITTKKNQLTIDNLYFKYPNNKNYALQKIFLDIKKGEIISITGESGSGKSTLVSLFLKLYSPTSGHILYDGLSIDSYDDNTYYSNICLITQDLGIFNDSLRNNLLVANEKSSDTELIKALNLSGLDVFFNELEKGLDTELGERGLILSGGQRQRVTIARSFLVKSNIIIFDEATSSLDYENEEIVLKNIIKHHKNKTIIFITHRQSPILLSTRLIKLKSGRIISDTSGYYINKN